MLEIKDLYVSADGKEILKGFSLTVKAGEVHALMGPNGAGKSTLAKVLAGHPEYEITSGEIFFLGKELAEMEPEDRAHLGLFMSFQYPPEISGISNQEFLYAAHTAQRKAAELAPLNKEEFTAFLKEKMQEMEMDQSFEARALNEGFSGGEKKRNEILQMSILDPKLSVLDETDSGLDIDAMRIVAAGVNRLRSKENGLLLITHYQRLLDYIKPDHIHVVVAGKIAFSGGSELALELEEKGYDWLTPRKEGTTC